MFCEHCRKIIERRIKYLESLDKGKKVGYGERTHIIQQLNWLLEGGQERMDKELPTHKWEPVRRKDEK